MDFNTQTLEKPSHSTSLLTPAVPPNWWHVAAVLAKRYDLSHQYARVVAEQAGFGDAP